MRDIAYGGRLRVLTWRHLRLNNTQNTQHEISHTSAQESHYDLGPYRALLEGVHGQNTDNLAARGRVVLSSLHVRIIPADYSRQLPA